MRLGFEPCQWIYIDYSSNLLAKGSLATVNQMSTGRMAKMLAAIELC